MNFCVNYMSINNNKKRSKLFTKVQDKPKNFNVTKCKKLIGMLSDSTFATNFKKLLLVKFWYSVKEYPQLSWKSTKILLPTYPCEAGFSLYTSTRTAYYNRLNAEADMRIQLPFFSHCIIDLFFFHLKMLHLMYILLVPTSQLADLFFFLIFEFYSIYFFIQQVLISHQFYTHQCIHVNPNHPIHHTTTIPTPPRLSPLGVHTFVLCNCVSTSALQTGSSVPFF